MLGKASSNILTTIWSEFRHKQRFLNACIYTVYVHTHREIPTYIREIPTHTESQIYAYTLYMYTHTYTETLQHATHRGFLTHGFIHRENKIAHINPSHSKQEHSDKCT